MDFIRKERKRTCRDFQKLGGIDKMELQEYKEIEYELKNSTLPKQSVGKILDACKKQLIQNVVITGHNNAINTDIGNCPMCNSLPLRACDNNYCPNCGQKLNWEV